MATKRASARDPLAAGASRASGERRRRTRTPLLPAPGPVLSGVTSVEAVEALEAVAVGVDPGIVGHDPHDPRDTDLPAGTTLGAPAGSATETPEQPGAATTSPAPSDTRTTDPAPAGPRTTDPGTTDEARTGSRGGRPRTGRTETPRQGAGRKHRPHPTPGPPTPSAKALRRSGSRVDLQGNTGDGPAVSGGAGAAAGRVAARASARGRALRVVPDLEPAPSAPEPGTDPGEAVAPPSPVDASVPQAGTIRPGVEDLLQAGVAALRTVVSATGVAPEEVERQVAATLAFLRRRLSGDFAVDDFGFDADFTDSVCLPLLRPLYRSWFRVEVRGIENLPTEGGGLVVANHSGTVAMDSLMTQVAVHDEHPTHRHLRMLGADLVFSTPVVGQLARKTGSTLATNPDAERLLRGGELVGVWPEGFKGVGKPFSERYKLQRFGRGGFVSAAISSGVPIIPCSIVGAEEIYPMIGNMKTLARLLGAPYAPVTPTWPLLGPLGLVPLPSKWIIEFGVPVQTGDLGPGASDDPMLVFDLTDQIRETIQQTLYSLLMQRRSVFF